MKKLRNCVWCKKLFVSNRYRDICCCKVCRREYDKARKKARKEDAERVALLIAQQGAPKSRQSKIESLARSSGMSYGQYQAKLYMENLRKDKEASI